MIILYTDHRKKMVQEYKVIYRNSFKIWLGFIYIYKGMYPHCWEIIMKYFLLFRLINKINLEN